ncbi:hypothetical protein VP01_1369g2 [Puccinia sorghi]|uniref:Uncharacterized protein n=1 Tax=Puccinia sorghi TaxID=27349 RepID=A0A0L6VNK3_9BASI|nr:hypothetical protein VP01_1369g2 [Puccinia sorghi]
MGQGLFLASCFYTLPDNCCPDLCGEHTCYQTVIQPNRTVTIETESRSTQRCHVLKCDNSSGGPLSFLAKRYLAAPTALVAFCSATWQTHLLGLLHEDYKKWCHILPLTIAHLEKFSYRILHCKKNLLNCLQLTCRNHCADCTVTVPKHLHMQTGGVWLTAWLEHAACQLQAVKQLALTGENLTTPCSICFIPFVEQCALSLSTFICYVCFLFFTLQLHLVCFSILQASNEISVSGMGFHFIPLTNLLTINAKALWSSYLVLDITLSIEAFLTLELDILLLWEIENPFAMFDTKNPYCSFLKQFSQLSAYENDKDYKIRKNGEFNSVFFIYLRPYFGVVILWAVRWDNLTPGPINDHQMTIFEAIFLFLGNFFGGNQTYLFHFYLYLCDHQRSETNPLSTRAKLSNTPLRRHVPMRPLLQGWLKTHAPLSRVGGIVFDVLPSKPKLLFLWHQPHVTCHQVLIDWYWCYWNRSVLLEKEGELITLIDLAVSMELACNCLLLTWSYTKLIPVVCWFSVDILCNLQLNYNSSIIRFLGYDVITLLVKPLNIFYRYLVLTYICCQAYQNHPHGKGSLGVTKFDLKAMKEPCTCSFPHTQTLRIVCCLLMQLFPRNAVDLNQWFFPGQTWEQVQINQKHFQVHPHEHCRRANNLKMFTFSFCSTSSILQRLRANFIMGNVFCLVGMILSSMIVLIYHSINCLIDWLFMVIHDVLFLFIFKTTTCSVCAMSVDGWFGTSISVSNSKGKVISYSKNC